MRSNCRKCGVTVTASGVPPHQSQMCDLVARVQVDDGVPAVIQAQQVEVAESQLLAPFLGPRVVAVLREKLPGVELERLTGHGDVVVEESPAR